MPDASGPPEPDPDLRFRALFEQLPMSAVLYRLDGSVVTYNQAFCALWGVPPAAAAHLVDHYNILQDPVLRANGLMPYVERGFEGAPTEIPIVAYDPRDNTVTSGLSDLKRWVGGYLFPVRDAAGNLRNVVLMHEDVTERHDALIALSRSEELLTEAQRLGNVGHWEHVFENGRTTLSDELRRLVAWPEGLPSFDDIKASVGPASFADICASLRTCIATGDDTEMTFRGEIEGELRWFHAVFRVTRAPDGAPQRMLGIVRDVTRARTEADRLERHRVELQRAGQLMALGTVAAGVAHEVNNPNHFIRLTAPLMRAIWADALPILDAWAAHEPAPQLGGLPYAEVRQEMLDMADQIATASDRIANIVAELRGFAARSHASGGPQTFDPDRAIANVLPMLRHRIVTAASGFETRMHGALPEVRGEIRRFEQVIVNLVVNACEAVEPSRGRITVATDHDPATETVTLTVTDDGGGIPEALIGRIMDPFVSTKQSDGGIGLGLAIVSRILDDMDGTLTFAQGDGGGTVACVRVPVATPS